MEKENKNRGFFSEKSSAGITKTLIYAWGGGVIFLDRLDKSSCQLILAINFKPTLLSQRLHRSAPDTVWLNPKSRFKLIPELIASGAPKCI